MSKSHLAEEVRAYLLGILPPGVPPQFTDIKNARTERQPGRREVFADLVMIDGLTATVRLTKWTRQGILNQSHRYTVWEGAPLYYDDGQWKRDTKPYERIPF